MKKILSLLLTVAMLVVPTSALATEELSTYSAGNSLKFDADFSEFEEDTPYIYDKLDTNTPRTKIDGSYTQAEAKADRFGENMVKYLEFKGGEQEDYYFATFRTQKDVINHNNMTVEIWAKPNVGTENVKDGKNRVLFSVSRAKEDNSTFNATFSDTKLIVTVRDADGNPTAFECDASEYMNKWSHFTFTRSIDTEKNTINVRAYVNSQSVIDNTVENFEKQTEDSKYYFYIGAYGTRATTQFPTMYIGGVSEVRVYSEELNKNTVGLNYLKQLQSYIDTSEGEENPDEPVETDSEYLFDLSVGDTIAALSDVSGSNIDVFTTGTPTIGTFNGLNGAVKYVKTESKTELQNIYFSDSKLLENKELMLEFYMKTPDFNENFGEMTIFRLAKGVSNVNNVPLMFKISSDGNGSVGMNRDGDYTAFFQANGLKDKFVSGGTWAHIVLTRAFEEGAHKVASKLYVNGELVGSGEIANVYALNETESHKYYFGDNNYVGGFSEIRVFDSIMSDSDIKNKYEENIEKYTAQNSGEVFELNGKTEISKDDSALSFKNNGSESVNDIKLTDLLTGKEIVSDINYTSDGFDVNFNQYLKYGQQIKVFSPLLNKYTVKTVSKGNSTATVTVYNSKNTTIDKLDGSDNYVIIVEVKNNGLTPMNYKYSVIAKDNNNDILDIEGGTGDSAYVSFENMKNATKIFVYVWEDVNGKLIPLYGMPMILK